MNELQPFFDKIYLISTYTPLIPLLVGLFHWRKLSFFPYKIIFIKLIVSQIILVWSNWLSDRSLNNHFLFYLSPSFDIVLMSITFGSQIKKEWLKKVLGGISIFFLAAFAYEFFFLKTDNFMSSYLSSSETLVVVVLIIYYFYWLFYVKQELNLKKNGIFWIALSYLLANLFALSYTIFATTLNANVPDVLNFITIAFYPIFSILCDILIAYGFHVAAKQRKW